MPEFSSHEELLRPSLGAEDDALDFDRPWDPMSLVMVSFFCGPIAGGVLLVMNFKRLGKSRAVVPAALAVGGVSLILFAAAAWAVTRDDLSENNSRLLIRAVTVVMALVLAWRQKKRYRLFEYSDLEKGKLLVPVILALIGGLVVNVMLIGFFITMFGG